jgi:hypothetical protein
MSAEVTQEEATYEAVDPTALDEGDVVIVQDVAGDLEERVTVSETTIEWGRAGVVGEHEDGTEVTYWEETGRTFTRVVPN